MRARCVIDMLVVAEGETPIHDRAGVPQVAVDAVRIHFQARLPSNIAADDGPGFNSVGAEGCHDVFDAEEGALRYRDWKSEPGMRAFQRFLLTV